MNNLQLMVVSVLTGLGLIALAISFKSLFFFLTGVVTLIGAPPFIYENLMKVKGSWNSHYPWDGHEAVSKLKGTFGVLLGGKFDE